MLDAYERLAVLTALEKRLKVAIEDARAEVAGEMSEKSEPILIGGREVGSVTMSYTRAAPTIANEAGALTYLDSRGLCELRPKRGWEKGFAHVGGHIVNRQTGDVVDAWFDWKDAAPRALQVRGCDPAETLAAAHDIDIDELLGIDSHHNEHLG